MNLHERMIEIAEYTVLKHTTLQGGEVCFNLPEYILDLGNRVEDLLEGYKEPSPVQGFKLDGGEIARYLWCCLATTEPGGEAYPSKFRGMPVLD